MTLAALLLSLSAVGADPPEIRAGDAVICTVGTEARARFKRQGLIPVVIVCRSLDDYKELDAHVGPKGRVLDDPDDVRLPSGRRVEAIPDRSPAVVLEAREVDGVKNDTLAARVRLVGGPKAGEVYWVRQSRLFPTPKGSRRVR